MTGTQGAIFGVGGPPDYVSGSPGGLDVYYTTLENSYGSSGGVGILVGSNDDIEHDCLTHNGEYGFNVGCDNTQTALCNNNAAAGGSGPEHGPLQRRDQLQRRLQLGRHSFSILARRHGANSVRNVHGSGWWPGRWWRVWATWDSTFTNNYVHNNYSVAAWWTRATRARR